MSSSHCYHFVFRFSALGLPIVFISLCRRSHIVLTTPSGLIYSYIFLKSSLCHFYFVLIWPSLTSHIVLTQSTHRRHHTQIVVFKSLPANHRPYIIIVLKLNSRRPYVDLTSLYFYPPHFIIISSSHQYHCLQKHRPHTVAFKSSSAHRCP